MKIILDTRMYGREFTGIGRYTLEMVNELMRIPSDNDYFLLLRKKYYNLLQIPPHWHKILVDIPHYSLEEQLLLPKIIQSLNPNLVHFMHLNVPLLYKGSYIVSLHDLIMHKQGYEASTLPLPLYLAKRIPFKLIVKHAVKNARQVIVPTLAVKKDVIDYYKIPESKVTQIYDGVASRFKNTNLKTKVKSKSLPNFLYVGNLYPHKNVQIIVEAIKILKTDNINVTLTIVSGQSTFRNKLQEYSKELGLTKNLIFKENINDKELIRFYASSQAYIFPTKDEGFGLPGLEAMAVGTPVIASDIPVLKEVYKDNVYYFDSMSPNSLAEAMKRIMKIEKSTLTTHIKKAQEYATSFSWEETAKETLRVYEGVKI